jgi:hypothetical protein
MDATVERYLVFAKADPKSEDSNIFEKCAAIQKDLKENSDISVYIGIKMVHFAQKKRVQILQMNKNATKMNYFS